jgi:2-isopropylmalate synthase
VEVYRRALDAGADRLSIVDTVGILTPQRMAWLVRRVTRACRAPLHVHCHNDLGMAVANALSAVEAGATVIDVTINGLGERSGIVPLAEACAALKTLYGVPNAWDLEALPELSQLVARYAGVPVSRYQPIVGPFAFAHKAGLHTAAVLRDPASYEAMDPGSVGAERRIIVDGFAGKSTLRHELARRGLVCDETRMERILRRLKSGNGGARQRVRMRSRRSTAGRS